MTAPHPALREPTDSTQLVAYLRARQQGHPRSFAAAYANYEKHIAAMFDAEWGFDLQPVQNLQVGA